MATSQHPGQAPRASRTSRSPKTGATGAGLQSLFTRYKSVFTYANLVEYALPAAALVLLVLMDIRVLFGKNLLELMPSAWASAAVVLFALVVVGWLMYYSRFYSLFPRYRSIKTRFRQDIAARCADILPPADGRDELYGKYLYTAFWERADQPILEAALRQHVQWVSMVHITNALSVSVAFLLGAGVFRLLEGGITLHTLVPYVAPLFAAHIILWIYFFIAGTKNLKRSNFFILDKLSTAKPSLAKAVPNDLATYIDRIG